MPLARASELDRLLACPGSLILPRSEIKSERAQAAANWGTAVHHWKETGEVPKGLKKKLEVSGVQRETYWFEGLHEVPLSYNVITGEVRALILPVSFEKKSEWKAAHDGDWVVGTADYVGLLLEAPWVDDLKTGRIVDYLDHRYQQAFYALCWTLFQMGELTECRSTITHWPKYPLNNVPRRFGAVLEPEFFRDFQGRLRGLRDEAMRLKERVERGVDVSSGLSDGPQCTYCPSKLACVKGQKYV